MRGYKGGVNGIGVPPCGINGSRLIISLAWVRGIQASYMERSRRMVMSILGPHIRFADLRDVKGIGVTLVAKKRLFNRYTNFSVEPKFAVS